MTGKPKLPKNGYYVSRSKDKSVLAAAANGHLSVWPSAQVLIAGAVAIFIKDRKKVWETSSEYASLNFELTPLQSGWFGARNKRSRIRHFVVVADSLAFSLCGLCIEVECLQLASDCQAKCSKCTKVYARTVQPTA